MIGKRTAIAGRTLAWIVLGGAAFACFWIMASSAIYLSLEGRWGDPRIRAFERPVIWALRVAQGGRDLAEVLNLILAGLAPMAPTLALVRWQWRRLGGLIGITRRATGFDRIRRGTTLNHGNADYMAMEQAAQIFPSTPNEELGGVVVGELERVDLGPAAKVRFNPRNRETWGNGGTAPLMIDRCEEGSTHSIVIGGSGAYKTARLVSTLLTWRKSAVVLDPKEEVADIVGEAIEASGRRVRRLYLGAFGPNILKAIDPADGRMAETRLRRLVSRVIGPMPKDESGNGAKFKRWGRSIIIALLADLIWRDDVSPEEKNLRTLGDGLSVPDDLLRSRLRGIYEHSPSPLARRMATVTMDMPNETWGGAASNARDDTEWLASEVYANVVSGGADFEMQDLVNGTDVLFVEVPLEALETTPAVARVLIGTALDAVFAAKDRVNGRVMFPVDEAYLLGADPSLKIARDLGRSCGITLQLYYQSEGQIEEVWGAGRTGKQAWFDSVSWRQYTLVSNLETAKDLSATLGTYGAVATSRGENSGRQSRMLEMPSMSAGSGTNEHEISREVAKPHELLQEMRADETITIIRNGRPIRHGAAIYFRRPEMLLMTGERTFDADAFNPEYGRENRPGAAAANPGTERLAAARPAALGRSATALDDDEDEPATLPAP
jgi:type IV secretion system protein VirD4